MKYYMIVLSLLFAVGSAKDYNILSLDGASYKGYMTAYFTSFLEKKAYFIARRDKCIQERVEERVSMTEIFDMIAGSETGAIIASTLVVPKEDGSGPKYFSKRAMTFFQENAMEIYVVKGVSTWNIFFMSILISAIPAYITFKVLEKTYTHENMEEMCKDFKTLIKYKKQQAKKKEDVDDKEVKKLEDKCQGHVMTNSENHHHKSNVLTLRTIFQTIQGTHENQQNLDQNDQDTEDSVQNTYSDLNGQLNDLQKVQNEKMGWKWYGLIAAAVLSLIMTYNIIVKIQYAVIELKDPKTIMEKLNFIPEDLTIDQIVSEDAFITAWDINNRSPRFFNKWSAKPAKEGEPKNNHTMKFKQMILASSSQPLYFQPSVIDGNMYISGDNMAVNPAMYAYLYAKQKKSDGGKINVITIGSTNELSEDISSDASVFDWTQRLQTLSAPVKHHTQTYMLDKIMKHNEGQHLFQEFQLDRTAKQEKALRNSKNREQLIEDLSEDMIQKHMEQAEILLSELIKERFKDECKNQ